MYRPALAREAMSPSKMSNYRTVKPLNGRTIIWSLLAFALFLGACGSAVELAEDPRLGPPLAHRGGLLADASRELLQGFFAKRRVEE